MKGLEKCESRDSFSIENKLTGAYDLGHKRRLFGEYFNFNLYVVVKESRFPEFSAGVTKSQKSSKN